MKQGVSITVIAAALGMSAVVSAVALYFNISPTIIGAIYLLPLIAIGIFYRRRKTILLVGVGSLTMIVLVIIIGSLMYKDFSLLSWLQVIARYVFVAILFYVLSRRTSDLRKLSASEQRLDLVLGAIAAGVWDWDVMNNKRWWSPQFFGLLGYEYNEITPSTEALRQFIHPDDASLFFKIREDHLAEKSKFEMEVRFKTKSGQYKWVLVNGLTTFDNKGKPVRMLGSIIDIDEKRKAQQVIQQQAALIQMIPDGIFYYNKDRNIISLNDGAKKMFEIKEEEIIGKNIASIIHYNIIGSTPGKASTELEQTGVWRGEVEITTRNGKKLTALVHEKAITDFKGSDPGFVAIYSDITNSRINEELKAAMKKLETNNQYLEQLAYISAHDIKSPIITLEGLVSLMIKSNAVKDEYSEMLKMLENTVSQMQRTNHSLNNILKLRKNLLSIENTDDQLITLENIMSDVRSTLQTEFDAVNARLDIDLNGISQIRFSYVHFKSIFYNLLSNAIKYRNPELPLDIRIEAKKQDDGHFLFIVEDNGLGIDLANNKDKIFGIFKRFHDHVEGAGIGLHIVKSIIDAYGGQIEVESTPGKGARFKITLKNTNIAQWN